jgi:hypothetical protein
MRRILSGIFEAATVLLILIIVVAVFVEKCS